MSYNPNNQHEREPFPSNVETHKVASPDTVPSPIMKYFTFAHLPHGKAKHISARCAELAEMIEHELLAGPEKSAGLRHLLEAKDCFVRQALP